MLIEQTIDKLLRLNLSGMIGALQEQMAQTQVLDLSFEERLGLLVDREWDTRETRRLGRRLKAARLKQPACVEEIDFRQPRGLDKSVFLSLAGCQWIKAHHNLILSGPTGVGKTFIACALANQACRLGYTALYLRTSRLLDAVTVARADGSYPSLTRKIEKAQLLILDDWGLTPLANDQARDMLDILEDRNQSGSTLIVTQLPVSEWHGRIADPTVADAILDRLIHNAYKIELRGESMRKMRANLD